MCKEATVSILVPVFNVEKYLKKSLESICNQTYKKIDIILVDDGSTDSSGLICKQFADGDARIRYVKKENGGVSSARNLALKMAFEYESEYIAFIDSDDYVEPNFIDRMMSAIANNDADMCMCRAKSETPDGQYIATSKSMESKDVILTGEEMLERLVKEHLPKYSVLWNKLYRLELFNGLCFADGKDHEDDYIIHHVYGKCAKCVVIDDVIYNYVVHNKSIMHTEVSEKRFGGVYALADRAEFFIQRNNHELAELTVVDTINVFADLMIQLGRTRLDKTLKQLLKRIRKLNRNIHSKKAPLVERTKLFLGLNCMPLRVWLQKQKDKSSD